MNNFEYIQEQISDASAKKREFEYRERLYYKPHFGPEETDQLLALEDARRTNQKSYINDQLTMQMTMKANHSMANKIDERNGDLVNLKTAYNTFIGEEQALRDKTVSDQ